MANGRDDDALPEHIRGLPQSVQIAVLYERVKNLSEDVRSLRRTLQTFIGAIVSGAILFLFAVAQGWFNKQAPTLGGLGRMVYHWF